MGSKRKQNVIEAQTGENTVKSKKKKVEELPKKKKTRKSKKEPLSDNLVTVVNVNSLETSCNELEEAAQVAKNTKSNDSNSDPAKSNAQSMDCVWPEEDMTELLRRMEEMIPPLDKLRFKSRVMRLDWDNIAFGNYSADDCRQMWEFIQRHVRCYRLLREVINDAKVWATKPWTSYRSHKLRKHPDTPRRPLSSYMLFYVNNKNKVLKKNPNLDMPSLSRHIAEMYKNLSPAKKEKYSRMAAEQREEYNKKLEEFYDKHPELVPLKKAQSLLPKKPFKIYYESKVEQAGPDVDKAQLLDKCKKKWKDLSDKKKSVWIELALQQNDSRPNTTENPGPETDHATNYKKKLQNLLTKEEKRIKEKMAGKPDKPPSSPYGLFIREMSVTEQIQSLAPKERLPAIANLWKDLDRKEKNEYRERLKHAIDQYKLEYATYLESLPEDERLKELADNAPKPRKKRPTKDVAEPDDDENEPDVSETVVVKTEYDDAQPTIAKKKVQSRTKKPVLITEETISPLKTVYPGEPKTPPVSAILLFAKKLLSEHKQLTKKELDHLWSNLSVEEKHKYRSKLNDVKRKYIISFEKFLKTLTQEQLKEYSNFKNAQNKQMELEISESEDESDYDEDNNCHSTECSENSSEKDSSDEESSEESSSEDE